MSRVRWLNIDWPKSIDFLVDGMLSWQFSEESGNGFMITKKYSNKCVAKYIQKVSVVDNITDPYGNILKEERVFYRTVNFTIIPDNVFSLELYNPPQLIRPFFNALNTLLDEFVVVRQDQVDIMSWLSEFECSYRPVKVNFIECSGINVENKGTAKVIVKSQQDIKKEAFDFLGSKQYSVDTIKCSFVECSKHYKFELSRNGAARIDEESELFLLPFLRDSLNATHR